MGVLAAFEGPKVAWSSLSPLLVLLGGAMVLLVVAALVPAWPRRLSSTFTALVAVATFITWLLMWHRVDVHGPVTLVGDAMHLDKMGVWVGITISRSATRCTSTRWACGWASPSRWRCSCSPC